MASRMTRKENWLRLIRNEQPAWIGDPWEAFRGTTLDGVVLLDPITAAVWKAARADDPCRDPRSTSFYQLSKYQDEHFPSSPDSQAISDAGHWVREIRMPQLDGYDWSEAERFASEVDRSGFLILCYVSDGLFERSQYIMGFEEALCNYMLEPLAVFELLGAIADWKIGQIERIIDHLHPDVILYRDSWGSRSSLFLPPEVWRRLIKPQMKRIVDAVKSRGIIFMHRTDAYCEPLIGDIAQIGVDIWQGAIPRNNITRIQKKLGGRMAIVGGIDASVIDRSDCSEASIRAEVRRCIDRYCALGSFIPCISNITPRNKKIMPIYLDELRSYGAEYARNHFSQSPRPVSAINLIDLAGKLAEKED